MNKAIGVSGLRSMDELLTNIIAQSLRECVAGAIVAKTLTCVGEGVRDYRLPNLGQRHSRRTFAKIYTVSARVFTLANVREHRIEFEREKLILEIW